MTRRYREDIHWFTNLRLWIANVYLILVSVGLLGFVSNDLARIRINPAAHGWWIRVNIERLLEGYGNDES